jgi:hypothetical protein
LGSKFILEVCNHSYTGFAIQSFHFSGALGSILEKTLQEENNEEAYGRF